MPGKQGHVNGLLSVIGRAVGGQIARRIAAVAGHKRGNALTECPQRNVGLDMPLAQVVLMGMGIHKAGGHDMPCAVDFRSSGKRFARKACNTAVSDAHIQDALDAVCRVTNQAVFQDQVKHCGILLKIWLNLCRLIGVTALL